MQSLFRLETIRAKIALLTGGLALLVVFGLGVFLYASLRYQLVRSVDENLRIRAAQLSQTVQTEAGELRFDRLALTGLNLSDDETAHLLAPDGTALDRWGEAWAPALTPVAGDGLRFATRQFTDREDPDERDVETFRFLLAPLERDGELLGYVQAGRDIEGIDESLSRLAQLLLLAGPALVALAAAGGYWLTGRALAPIEHLRAQADAIRAGDLGRRLHTPHAADEVGRLAHTFNAMLARLEDSFQRQRRFTADASHELRTPLAIIRGETELALDRPRTPAEYVETLNSVDVEAQRMSRLVEELLVLARADAGELPLSLERLDLTELLETLLESLERSAQEAGITLRAELPERLPVTGDRDRLLALFINLLENALVHAPASPVLVAAETAEDGLVRVTVADRGPGIAPDHLPHLFERFYRADPARQRAGSGLGLAIAQEIATAHGGWIEAASKPGEGTVFTVWLRAGGKE